MKKALKRLSVLLVAVLATMALAVPALADSQGSGTLTVSNATKGQTYKAYKVFDAVYADTSDPSKGVVYTVADEYVDQLSAPFSISSVVASNGQKVVVKADGTEDAAVLAWVKENYDKFGDTTGTALTYQANGTAQATLPYGYYYVTSTLGTVVSIDSVNTAVTVVDKNESEPTPPDKVITDEDSSVVEGLDQTGLTATENDAAVGSVETFKVTYQAANWVEDEEDDSAVAPASGYTGKKKVTKWTVTDTPTGLNIDISTVVIKVNNTVIYTGGESVDTTYVTTVTGGGTSAMTITIPWVDAAGASLYATQTEGSELIPVEVTYNATVTSAAATAPAPNTVNVTYTHDGTTDVELGEDTTTTYTYKFQLDKVKNEANNYGPLAGAEFQLYASDGTTLLKFDQDGTTYTYNPGGSVTTITMSADGTALIQGLDKADYVLKETKAPNGYNPAADTNIAAASLVPVNGTITDTAAKIGADDTGVVSVVNEQGVELPSTGGMGTTILYIVGALLVVAAGVALVVKRRMGAVK